MQRLPAALTLLVPGLFRLLQQMFGLMVTSLVLCLPSVLWVGRLLLRAETGTRNLVHRLMRLQQTI